MTFRGESGEFSGLDLRIAGDIRGTNLEDLLSEVTFVRERRTAAARWNVSLDW
jgi:hypothetical protein